MGMIGNSLAQGLISGANIQDGTVDTPDLKAGAVTNAKLGTDLDASKLTAGTLPIARVADGAVVNAKLGTDLDASKLTAGTLPIARIADGAVTSAKLSTGAPVWDSNGRLLAGIGTVTYTDYLADFYSNIDAGRYFYVRNASAGTSAAIGIQASMDNGGDGRLVSYGVNHSTNANNVLFGNFKAGGKLMFATQGTVRGQFDAAGLFGIGTVPSNAALHIKSDWFNGHSTVKAQMVSTGNTVGYGIYDETGTRLGLFYGTTSYVGYGSQASIPVNIEVGGATRAQFNTVGVLTLTPNRAANSTDSLFTIANTTGSDIICEAGNYSPVGISGCLRIAKIGSNGRSINAAGTVNQNGADYAEYMVKSGDFIVAKGDVIGINTSGEITNVFADAVSFVVKSTDPGLVGGDKWFTEPRPKDENGVEVLSNTQEYADWFARMEAVRATVDRIAFCGQVPVNVTGATPGQYIVPVNDNGAIKGEAVSNPTFEQYQLAVGKVIAVEQDGRARIIVKVA